jgi:bifunctional DNA-binding transcriptional regulator/antitoxin component of YhaV-PrlF toxin-antitoxin module
MKALKVKLIKSGGDVALPLPKEALAKLRAREGDTVLVTETADGVCIALCDSDAERQTAILEKVAAKRRNVLRRLGE